MDDLPDVLTALTALGGVARRGALVSACGRTAVDAAVRGGVILPVARGTWTSALEFDRARAEALALRAVLAYRSAALDRGWAVWTTPDRPEVIVPKSRRVSSERRRAVSLHRTDLAADDVDGHRTSADRTVLDCLRALPFPDALAVADSALRAGMTRSHLLAVTRDARGPGARRAREIAASADRRAANPFESALRAICLQVEELHVVPQVDIHDPHFLGRPDLVDSRLRIVLEADSFEWHGSREALVRDARRYNAFVAAGWLVLRFTWDDVMHRPEQVAVTLRNVVKRRTEMMCPGCVAA